MREHKYRAWDDDCYEIIQLEIIDLASDWQYYTDGKDERQRCPTNTLMQYTGLHDKNGKEIYEGDIVEWFDDTNSITPEQTNHKGMIEYSCGSFRTTYSKKWSLSCRESSGLTECKIIGNIHENPELKESNP